MQLELVKLPNYTPFYAESRGKVYYVVFDWGIRLLAQRYVLPQLQTEWQNEIKRLVDDNFPLFRFNSYNDVRFTYDGAFAFILDLKGEFI